MQIGKRVRLAKWFDGARTFILAIDQGIPRGVFPQIKNNMALWCSTDSPWDAVFLHQGHVMANEDLFASKKALPFIIKLTSNSKDSQCSTRRSMISSVERAAALGASGVGVNIFIGSDFEANHLTQLGEVVSECEKYGMPLIVLANPAKREDDVDAEKIAYACMIAAEMGADIVKTEYPGTSGGIKMAIDACMRPVIVEESPLPANEAGTLKTVEDAMAAGAAGVFLGSRIWAEKDPVAVGRKVREIVYK